MLNCHIFLPSQAVIALCVLSKNKLTHLFVDKWQTLLKATDKFLLQFFSSLPPRFICYIKPLPRSENQLKSDVLKKCFSLLLLLTTVHMFLCVSEINRVRKDMYSDTVNGLVDRHPLELPEPAGPIVHLQEKLFVPVKEYPDVSSSFLCLTMWTQTHNHHFRSHRTFVLKC